MYIKNLQQIRHCYRCRKCDKIFKNMEACNRHEKTCDELVKHTFPGGKYNKSQSIFDRIEDLYDNLIKKQKTYDLYNKFNPVVSNEDDKYYPYECAFDFEAMLKQIEITDNEKKLQERLAKLSGGVAVLYVGAATEVEMKEKKDRVDDALHATRAAVEEGIVPGGGVAFIRAIEKLEAKVKGQIEDEQTGMAIVRRALEEPVRILTANAGIDGSIVVQKIKDGKGDFGFNARTETYENMFKAGVIDPTKVSRVALENAASIAAMLLTTECVVADKPKKEEPHAHPAPDMGGMGGY